MRAKEYAFQGINQGYPSDLIWLQGPRRALPERDTCAFQGTPQGYPSDLILLQAPRRALPERCALQGTPQGYSSDLVGSLLEYPAGLLERMRLTLQGTPQGPEQPIAKVHWWPRRGSNQGFADTPENASGLAGWSESTH